MAARKRPLTDKVSQLALAPQSGALDGPLCVPRLPDYSFGTMIQSAM